MKIETPFSLAVSSNDHTEEFCVHAIHPSLIHCSSLSTDTRNSRDSRDQTTTPNFYLARLDGALAPSCWPLPRTES